MNEMDRTSTTPERIKEALEAVGKKQIDLANESGLSHSTVSRYLSGQVEPRQEAIIKMAKVLNVSEWWLWGYDVPKERSLEQKKNDDLAEIIVKMRKDPELIEFVSMALKLSPAEFASIKQILSGLVKE